MDPSLRARRVLVVEDDGDGREPLTEVLRLEGYEVSSAADGATAIACVRVETYDALVLDIGLPDVDGLDVIRAMRPHGGRPGRPHGPVVIVFSGYHRLRADAEAAGCDGFVLKPDLDDLLARLRTAVEAQGDNGGKR
jgi:two-component system KDP operon response regulator KdpE